MSDEVAIRVENLSKRYLVGHESASRAGESFREMLSRGARRLGRTAADMARGRQIIQGDEVEEFWALRDVSFEVQRGEVLGVIGRNGAGKSTLLKILSRITEPTEGRVTIEGRVASLLEVGTGFHPELSGRENIVLNGAILGMSRRETKAKFDEIVEFAEVERFLDTPVKRYSSGMYVRLAFAVAAHLEPEILVVDEVLAVGDADFQRKCLGKLSDVAGRGRTVLFVSHNMSAIERLCTRAIHLGSGTIIDAGPTTEIIQSYLSNWRSSVGNVQSALKLGDSLVFHGIEINGEVARAGAPCEIKLSFEALGDGLMTDCSVLIASEWGVRIGLIDLRQFGFAPRKYNRGPFAFTIRIENLHLVEGQYSLGLAVWTNEHFGHHLDLQKLEVVAGEPPAVVPYPPHVRGFVEFEASATTTA